MERQLMLDLGSACLTQSGAGFGEVFTRRWVVELILDLVGYTSDRDLARLVAIEPSCGEGAFVGPMLDRLLRSARHHGHDVGNLAGALCCFDLVEPNVEQTRNLA